jgi:glutathione S-transferase
LARVLHHFVTSPFSRRVRLALAHKKLDVELVDVRAVPNGHANLAKIWPLRTVPVLVDDGEVIGDSMAIARHLEAKHRENPIFTDTALEITTCVLVEGLVDGLVNAGTRYHFPNDPRWPGVRTEVVQRIDAAALALVERAPRLRGWTFAEMSLYAAIAWIQGFPGRVASNTNIQQIVSLGFRLPEPLIAWAAQHSERDDVRALG